MVRRAIQPAVSVKISFYSKMKAHFDAPIGGDKMGQGNFHTAPMLLLTSFGNGEFALEPYEAGWATEAIAFVYVREVHGEAAKLSVRAQISVDGQRWIETGDALANIDRAKGYYLPLRNFGNWLRLVGEVTGAPGDGSPEFVIDVYWSLKG